MRILIIGAGAVSSVISELLSRRKEISEIICATNDIEKAKNFINLKNPKISLRKVDANKIDQIVKIAKNVDLIINASLPNFNINIMKAALKVKANYQDLCSYLGGFSTKLKDLKHVEQLNLNKEFKKAKLIGLINTGISPGVTNLLAREGADELGNVLDIKVRVIEELETNEFLFTWSPSVTLDEITAPPLVYKNGKFTLTEPLSNLEEYNFPKPFGEKPVFSVFGDEVSTLPLYIKTKNVDYKAYDSGYEVSKILYKIGLLSRKPISIGNEKITPVEFLNKVIPEIPTPKKMSELVKKGIIKNGVFASTVEIIGKESRIKYSAIYPDFKSILKIFPGANYISYTTGLAAYIFAMNILKIHTYGVFPPEFLDSNIRKNILNELKRNKVIILKN